MKAYALFSVYFPGNNDNITRLSACEWNHATWVLGPGMSRNLSPHLLSRNSRYFCRRVLSLRSMMTFLIDVHLWINWNTNRFETLRNALSVKWHSVLLLTFFPSAQEVARKICKGRRAQERNGRKTHKTDGREERIVPESAICTCTPYHVDSVWLSIG